MHDLQQRLTIIRWHERNGGNVAATARQFGIARSTLYHWLDRYDPEHPRRSLKRQKRTPSAPRPGPRETKFLHAALELHRTHPRWGRRRLRARLLAVHSDAPSEATVGRWLAEFLRRCPVCRGREGVHSEAIHLVQERFPVKLARLPIYGRRRGPTEKVLAVREVMSLLKKHRRKQRRRGDR